MCGLRSPFAREYGGTLSNRSFGSAQVSRTFLCHSQTGQQLLLGAYQAMMRQVSTGKVKLFARREMLELVIVDGRRTGLSCETLPPASWKLTRRMPSCLRPVATATSILSTMAKGCNVTAA